MIPNFPDSNPPSLLDQVLAAAVTKVGKVAPVDLFIQLQELQGQVDDLLGDLCEHSYRELVVAFLKLCQERQLPPSPLRFEAWLTATTELPGYLVTVFGERLEQDQQDGEEVPAPQPDTKDRLEKLEEARLAALAPPAVEPVEIPTEAVEPLPANALVPPQPDE